MFQVPQVEEFRALVFGFEMGANLWPWSSSFRFSWFGSFRLVFSCFPLLGFVVVVVVFISLLFQLKRNKFTCGTYVRCVSIETA